MPLYHALGNAYQARVNVKIYDLFHDRQITSFAYTEGYKRMTEYTFSSWLVLLICLFAVSGVFAGEKEIQMDKLLKSTQKGYRATAYAKIAAALLFAGMRLKRHCLPDGRHNTERILYLLENV